MKYLGTLVTLSLFLAGATSNGQQVIISPFVPFGGNAFSSSPFDIGSLGVQSVRFQQVFASSDFLGQMPLGGYVNAIGFGPSRIFDSTLPSVQVDLSTTAKPVDGMSTVFTDNVGSDDKVVFGRGALQFSSLNNGRIVFSTPFFYDPRAGNLLLDVRNYGGGTSAPLMANVSFDDTVSVVSAPSVDAVSGSAFTYGLVTVFLVTAVPEPSTWALIGLSVVFVVSSYCWKRRPNNHVTN